jgi:hypothetical protein
MSILNLLAGNIYTLYLLTVNCIIRLDFKLAIVSCALKQIQEVSIRYLTATFIREKGAFMNEDFRCRLLKTEAFRIGVQEV